MKLPNPSNTDFNALRVLTKLHDCQSFTATAIAFDVNQSAVSYTIAKLRKVFGDPLFFRHGNRVIPTERCSEVVGTLSSMLEQFDDLVTAVEFDPATATREITIACNFYERRLIIPHILRRLRIEAPNIRLKTINSASLGAQQLKDGAADLLIGPLIPDEPEFYCRTLLHEHYVCIMDCTNPLATKELSLDAYIAANHVVVTYGGLWKSRHQVELEKLDLHVHETVSIPSPAGLGEMLEGTDLIATVPSRIAQTFEAPICCTPYPLNATLEIDLVWTTRTHHSPMHNWLRTMISKQVRECMR